MEWISVEDGLPEIKPYRLQGVIIHKSNGVVMEAYYNTKTEGFMAMNFSELNHQVTHWQPLPEPPK